MRSVVVVGCVVLVAGCGGSSSSTDDVSAVQAVVAKAAKKSSTLGARFVSKGVLSQDGKRTTYTARGEIEAGGERDHYRTVAEGQVFEEYSDGPFSYVPADQFPADPVTKGKKWIRLDQDTVLEQEGYAAGVSDLQNADPAGQAAQFAEASDEQEVIGPAKVRGRLTTRYRLGVPLGVLAEQVTRSKETKAEIADEVRNGRFRVDVWIDSSSIVRRVRLTGKGVTIRTDVVSSDRALKVRLPPKDDVVDITADVLESRAP